MPKACKYMYKSCLTKKMNAIDTQILNYLKSGERSANEIYEHITEPRDTLKKRVKALKQSGKIISVRRGVYALPGVEKCEPAPETRFFSPKAVGELRQKEDNAATINALLNLYDEVLIGYSVLMREILNSDQSLEKKENFLLDFKNLTLIGDRLMKRWNLENHGYDNNAKQAHEDAKAKTAKDEQKRIAEAPPEENIVVVREYGVTMKEILENMPGQAKEGRTV